MYHLRTLIGSDSAEIKRIDDDKLQIKIGDKNCVVFTEDLAALVKTELPLDRAAELFIEMQEKMVEKGRARVMVKAHKDIKQGDAVSFVIDITKYLDSNKNSSGLRATASGFIF